MKLAVSRPLRDTATVTIQVQSEIRLILQRLHPRQRQFRRGLTKGSGCFGVLEPVLRRSMAFSWVQNLEGATSLGRTRHRRARSELPATFQMRHQWGMELPCQALRNRQCQHEKATWHHGLLTVPPINTRRLLTFLSPHFSWSP